jgi:hypothetical protein
MTVEAGCHFFLARYRPFIAHCWMDWWNVSIPGHVLESGKAHAPPYAWLAAIKVPNTGTTRLLRPDPIGKPHWRQTNDLNTRGISPKSNGGHKCLIRAMVCPVPVRIKLGQLFPSREDGPQCAG